MAEGTPSIPELDFQKKELKKIADKVLARQDTWCLIDNKWFTLWKKHVGFDNWETANVGVGGTHPGPIDNSPLLKDDGSGEIKDHLIDELDYVLLPEEAWDLLVKWYGLVQGQQSIARKVVEYGIFVKHYKVEVYLLEFKLCSNSDLEYFVTRKFSKSDTIGSIEKEMRDIFGIPDQKETRLWNIFSHATYVHLNKESSIQDAGLYHGQVLIIEQMNDDGTWPRQVKRATSKPGCVDASVSYPSFSYAYEFQPGSSNNVQPGLCGVNSVLQKDEGNRIMESNFSTVCVEDRGASADLVPIAKKPRREYDRVGSAQSPGIEYWLPSCSAIVNKRSSLRPIVIDGNNVACLHGVPTKSYSCKGIHIAVSYFLSRGHTKVTAMVPRSRLQKKFGKLKITDQHLLEKLTQTQNVVLTPSRWIENRLVESYDDRFIVELAAETGGVILSNDNYRDLIGEREDFKKAVHERLLMFLFVGDRMMLPKDPLGREGPSLEVFLSFSN